MSQPSRDFTVGALAFRVEGATGMLRNLRFGGREVLRGIYPAVRDEQWRTLPAVVAPMTVHGRPGELRIAFDARVAPEAVDVRWHVEIEANARGTIRYCWRAHATHAFRTNRAGLCVLHPAEAAGQPCWIEHVDGRKVAGWFPVRISPHQPFRDIRAITHLFAPGAEATVRMEGDVFEMEDQRNWSDASFKTYCRPLDRPRPYAIARDESIEHTVTVDIAGVPPRAAADAAAPRFATPSIPPLPLPRIGFALTGPLPAARREKVRALRPAHLRVGTTMRELDATLAWARPEVEAIGCELELAVRGASEDAPAHHALPGETTVLLYDGDGNAVPDACVQAWRTAGFPRVGTGTENHFTELNRQRPSAAGAHILTTFGLNAQVHAFDDASLLETVTQHAVLAEHARRIGAPRAVAVGPIVLGPSGDSADPRLHSAFGAQWTLGSLAELTRAGVARATYFRLDGAGGFLRDGEPTPLELLFRALAGATEADLLAVDGLANDGPHPVYALVVRMGTRQRLLMAHTGGSPLDIQVPFSGEGGALGAGLTRTAAGRVMLAPRSVWQLDLG